MKRSQRSTSDSISQKNNSKTQTIFNDNSSASKSRKLPSNRANDFYSEITNYYKESNRKDKLKINNPETQGYSYIQRLEQKIQEQAKRLTEMCNYISLCEKRLKQLSPEEKFPITKDNLNTNTTRSEKYDLLYSQYSKLLQDYNNIISIQKIENTENSKMNTINSNRNYKNDEHYLKLKAENKELNEEKNKIAELLRQQELNNEEQKKYITILQQTIDNDLIKNGTINKYISTNDLIDFTKLKSENEHYRKQLVLSQAIINSLKAEIDQYPQDKEKNKSLKEIKSSSANESLKNILMPDKNKEIMNKPTLTNHNDKMNSEIIIPYAFQDITALKSTLNSQMQIISNLKQENANLRKLIEESKSKISSKLEINNNSNIEIKQQQSENDSKFKVINEYETKFMYFNDYISEIKSSLKKIQNALIKYTSIYNQMANDDLNSLLTKSFSESIANLKTKTNQMKSIEKYSLDIKDKEVHNNLLHLLKLVHNEFLEVYEKVFQSNDYYKESNYKVEHLENKIKNNKQYFIHQKENLNELKKQIEMLTSENEKMKNLLNDYNNRNYNLDKEKNQIKRNFLYLKKEKDNLLCISQILIKFACLQDYGKLYQEAISLCEMISKLYEEKEHVKEKIDELKVSKIEQNENNKELYNMVQKENNTLLKLNDEFEKKIKEKENRLDQIKNELNDLYIKSTNAPNNRQTFNYKMNNQMNAINSNITNYNIRNRENDEINKMYHYKQSEYINNEENNLTQNIYTQKAKI